MAQETFNSKKFEGFTLDCSAGKDSRLNVTLQVKASVDLPGEADAVVAQLIGMIGLGNSKEPSDSSGQ